MIETARVRIGNQTSRHAPSLMLPFEYAMANRFDAFEWFPDKNESGAGWEESDISKETRIFIRDTALAGDIRLSVHASLQSNPVISDAGKLISKTIGFAQDIGATLINIHFYNDKGVAAFADAIAPLGKRLAKAGIQLSIENTLYTGPQDFNELFRSLRSLERTGNVGMCLDLGHANLYYATRNDYLKFVDLLDPEVPVIHIHMHENYGDCDSHLPIFTGPAGKDAAGITGFMERMNKRNFSGSIILEQWPQPEGLLNEARTRLIEIINSNSSSTSTSASASAFTSAFTPASDDFVNEIVAANRRFLSWQNRLGWVYDVLTCDTFDLNIEHLLYIAIYLRFIGTGEVPCGEEGGHHRPWHHAKMAQQIYGRLSNIITPENFFIIRKIYPWLPSFDSAFTRAEPLTRIRDIAHRNDIPGELKKEIKDTLQNKLHRSAGPEDLATSKGLLTKITAPDADYSPAFVEEFKRFHSELKEFFNAATLDERLSAIEKEIDLGPADSISAFLRAKKEIDTPQKMLTVLELLTGLRGQFCEMQKLQDETKAQKFLMADIGLEDFSFVILSRLAGRLSDHFDVLKDRKLALSSLVQAIRNLRLSGLDPEECRAIESELKSWSEKLIPADREELHEELIRLKATLDRYSRLAEDYCHKILSLFPEKAERLGRALDVAGHAIKVFGEADIRGHIVFQVSKLVDLLRKSIRTLANLPSWDIIVPGKASGRLVAAGGLGNLSDGHNGPFVALLERAEGDEEIPAWIAGIIVAHGIPHLAHLAVRARQSHVVFAACEDRGLFSELTGLAGQLVTLDAFTESVSLKISSGITAAPINTYPIEPPHVILNSAVKLLPLKEVTPENGGGKADSARRLEEMSRLEHAGLKTAAGIVIPFGVMETCLSAKPALEREYKALVGNLNRLRQSDLAGALTRLQDIINHLPVPAEIVSGVLKEFTRDERLPDRLIVRSSANCEDMRVSSGAGLYDSVANVQPSDVAPAILKVWASLWNVRAVMNRRNTGIQHERAVMAVLIQKMLVPELSFIMNTRNPVSCDPGEIYIELAVGLGETLASAATPGSPYRAVCYKETGEVRMLSFASFSHALLPGPSGGITAETIDYTGIRMSMDRSFRNLTVGRLGTVGKFVENALSGPQDIEGVISGDGIYLVQSRAQHLPSCSGAFSKKN